MRHFAIKNHGQIISSGNFPALHFVSSSFFQEAENCAKVDAEEN